jgi:hypothetical protein
MYARQSSTFDFIESYPDPDGVPRYGTKRIVAVSTEGVVKMRDPAAHELMQRLTRGRQGFSFRYCSTRHLEPPVDSLEAGEIIFIGRRDLFQCGRYREFAHALGLAMWGRYVETPHEGPVDCLRYERLEYRRRQCDEIDRYRLFDVDFGQIIRHPVKVRGVPVIVSGLCGIGELATALTAKTMYEPRLRAELRRQAEELVTDHRGLRPDLGHELVVKFSLPDPTRIGNLLDEVMLPLGSAPLDQLPFRFRLELIAIARADGSYATWAASAPRLTIVEEPGFRGVRMGAWQKRVAPKPLALVGLLNGQRDGVQIEQLAKQLYPGNPRGMRNVQALVYQANEHLLGEDPPDHLRAWIGRSYTRYVLHLRPFGS